MLVEPALAINEDMMRGFVKLRRIASIDGTSAGVTPVVSRGNDLEMGFFGSFGKFNILFGDGLLVQIIAEIVCSEPNGLYVGIEIVGRAFLHVKGQYRVKSVAVPSLIIDFKLDQALEHRGVVRDIQVVVAFHLERRTIAEQLHPLATEILHSDIADAVIRIAGVDTLVFIMRVDGTEGSHMRGQGIFAMNRLLAWGHHQITIHGHSIYVVEVVGDCEVVVHGGGLAARLGDGGGHVEITERVGFPQAVPIAIVGVVGMGGLQLHGLAANAARNILELDHVAVFNMGAQHQHHGPQLRHIYIGVVVRPAKRDLRYVVVRVDHREDAVHRRCRLPLGAVAGLRGTDFHLAFLTRQGDGVATHGRRTFQHFELHRQSRGCCGIHRKWCVEGELVGDGVKLDELRGQSRRGMTHHDVVEAAVRRT